LRSRERRVYSVYLVTDDELHAVLLANDSVQGVPDRALARWLRLSLEEVQSGLHRLAQANRAVRVANDYGSSASQPFGLWRAR
jgi:hypothetical protein